MINPFIFGSPVTEKDFIGRSREIRRIAGRIVNGGQSAAISAEPGMGKNSLLRYLSAPQKRVELYGDLAPRIIFQYIDATTLGSAFTQTQFWWLALVPLAENLSKINLPAVTASYEICKNEGFSVYNLEKLFSQLQAAGWRLVLVLNEFDNLLTHPVLNQSEFYGGLRSLASRYDSLTLITASRQPLEKLNENTQKFNRMGSPYFNFMYQVSLGAFTELEVYTLLARGDEHFTKADKKFLHAIAGGHPALLQAAAYALWEAYEDQENSPQTRWENASRDLLEAARPILSHTWQIWSPETRKAMTIIALDRLPRLVSGKEFVLDILLASLTAYLPEMDELQKRGFLADESSTRTGHRFQSQVMLWWLAGELVHAIRPQSDDELGEWLRKQEWDGLLKADEKSQLKQALASLSGLITIGSETFIRATVENFDKRLTSIVTTPSKIFAQSGQVAVPVTSPILIIAVTKVEVQTILKVFSAESGSARRVIGNKTYYDLGVHGGAPIFMTQSEMGSAVPGGALLTVSQAIQDLHPQAVILYGFAHSLHPDKQRSGDILIAKQLQSYEPQKVGMQQSLTPCGDRTTVSGRLLDRFKSADIDWKGAITHFGLVLSGEKLGNDPHFRNWLLQIEPDAIGCEMEGTGLYAAAHNANVDWILVKAVCDEVEDKSNNDAQVVAANNAAQFVLHVLQLGNWDSAR